jgi:hypothetical protein
MKSDPEATEVPSMKPWKTLSGSLVSEPLELDDSGIRQSGVKGTAILARPLHTNEPTLVLLRTEERSKRAKH